MQKTNKEGPKTKKRFMSFSRLSLDKGQQACMRQWEKCILTDLNNSAGKYDEVGELTRVEDGRLGKKFTAAHNIPNGTVVGWYKGDVLEKNDARANINYVVELPPQDLGQGKKSYWLDGSKWLHDHQSNIIFINHSCLDFNCEMHTVVLPTRVYYRDSSDGLYHPRSITAFYIIAITIRDILAGEELLTNYDGGSDTTGAPDQFHFFDTESKQRESLTCENEDMKNSLIRPCECRPEGCPLNYVYVKKSCITEKSGSDGDNSSSGEEDDHPPLLLPPASYKSKVNMQTSRPLKKRRNLFYDNDQDSDHDKDNDKDNNNDKDKDNNHDNMT
jgi:hypothetical protein